MASDVLLLSVPARISLGELQRTLESLPGIDNIHHVHLWRASELDIHFEAHVEVEDGLISDSAGLVNRIEEILKERYGIAHATVQIESGRCENTALLGAEPMVTDRASESRR